MKILKYLLGFLVLLIIGFLILGFVIPEVSYSSEVEVNKPASEAWAVMSDERKLSQWITGFVKSELVSGNPNEVGAVSNVHIDNNGEVSVIKETITKMVPNKTMAMDFSMDPMDMDYELQFDERNGKTYIKSSTSVTGKGMLMKSLMALMKGGMQKQEDINMGKLKKLVNENMDNYFAPVTGPPSEG